MESLLNDLPTTSCKALLVATIAHQDRRLEPFASDDENASYGNLAKLCADRGIDLHVTHFDNLSSPANTIAWAWRGGSWRCVDLRLEEVALCYADLPPHADGAEAFRDVLGQHPITIVNDLRLSDLLTDKLATFGHFAEHVPYTWNAGTPDLVDRVRASRLHSDLSIETLFLKPRLGERGRGIVVTDLDGLGAHSALRSDRYILQAFLDTRSGLPELGIHERHDLRLILRDGAIALAFARLPAQGSLVSNCSQGGHELPVAVDALPARVARFAADIDERLGHFGTRLYSLDLGVGRSGKIWIYELNTMPGIVWSKAVPENQPLHRSMHRSLADWLSNAARQVSQLSQLPRTAPSSQVSNRRW